MITHVPKAHNVAGVQFSSDNDKTKKMLSKYRDFVSKLIFFFIHFTIRTEIEYGRKYLF